MKMRALLLSAMLLVSYQAQAGLFSDDEARKKIEALEARINQLEEGLAQQTRALLDLQSQIEAQNTDLRKMRGQNEELAHGLVDGEKRQKDFYVDLDTRLRAFEVEQGQAGNATKSGDLVAENRALEAAYGLYKAQSYPSAATAFQDFITRFPKSVQLVNAQFWMGDAYLNARDFPSAIKALQASLDAEPNGAHAPDALLKLAIAQESVNQPASAKKTLKKLIAQFPSSDAAGLAKKRLANLK
jgi:tol-pal system protein YbgF